MKRITVIIFCLVLFQGTLLFSQSSPPSMSSDITARETTNIGRFRITLGRSAMTGSAILKDRDTHYITFWGNDDTGRQASNFGSRSSLLGFGAKNWTAPDGTYYDQIVLPKVNNLETKLITKYPYYTLTVDGMDKSIAPTYDEVDPDLISDQLIVQTFETDMGLSVTARAYVWGEPRYDDFAILHYEIVNNGPDLQDFIITQFHQGNVGSEDQRHDPGVESNFCNYYGADEGDSLHIWYWFDGDDPKNQKNDEGNPHSDTGEFLSPEYWGWGLMHADKSPSDRTNDPNQPSTAYRTSREELTGIEDGPFYTFATSGTFPPYIDPDSGYDPFVKHDYVGGMTIGPYSTFPSGDTLNVVFFCGMAAPTIPEAKEWGAKWKNGEITKAEKNNWLRSSRGKLFGFMSKALKVWNNNLHLPEGEAPPPTPAISLTSGGGEATIKWQAVSGNVSYDLYRAVVEEELLAGGSVRLRYIYEPIATDLTNTEYVDEGLKRGETYYYFVVTKDNLTGLESSHYYLRNPNGATIFAPPTDKMATIRVVPNPYNISHPAYATKNRIVFAGLPGPCKIRIFTESGDLVTEINHPYKRGSAEWDQISQFDQLIKSGIYIYQVESTEGLGEKIGRFVIIR